MAVVDVGILVTFVNRATAGLKTLGSDMDRVERSGARAENRLRAIHVVLAGIAAGSLLAFGKRIVETVADLESMQLRLAAVEGGLVKARETFKSLAEEFRGAPVDVTKVIDSYSRFRFAGIEIDKARRAVAALADANSAAGGTTFSFERAQAALTQMVSKGQVYMEELRQQLGEHIPFAMQAMAAAANKSVGEFIRDVGKGLVSGEEGLRLFYEGMERIVGGFSKLMRFSMRGAMAEFQTEWKLGLNRVFLEDSSAARGISFMIRRITEEMSAAFAGMGRIDLRPVIKVFEDLVKILKDVAPLIGAAASALGQMISAVTGAVSSIGGDVAALGVLGFLLFGRSARLFTSVAAGVGGILATLGPLGSMVGAAVGGALATVNGVLGTLGSAAAYGIIGYALFGKVGAIFGVFAAIDEKMKEMTGQGAVSNVKIAGSQLGFNIRSLFGGDNQSFLSSKTSEELQAIIKAGGMGPAGKEMGEMAKKILDARNAVKDVTTELDRIAGRGKNPLGTFDQFNTSANIAAQRLGTISQAINSMVSRDLGTKAQEGLEKLSKMQKGFADTVDPKSDTFFNKQRTQLQDLMKVFEPARARLAELQKGALTGKLSQIETKELDNLSKSLGVVDQTASAAEVSLAKIPRAAAIMGENLGFSVAQKLKAVSDQLDSLTNKAEGDTLGKAISDANNKFNEQGRSLEKIIHHLTMARVGVRDKNELLTQAQALMERLRASQEKMVEKIKEEHALKRAIFENDQQRERLDVSRGLSSLRNDMRSPFLAAFASTSVQTAQDKTFDLQGRILDTMNRINAAKQRALETTDPEQKAMLQETIGMYEVLLDRTREALASTSAVGEASRELWKSVGDSIQEGVGEALRGLIKGSKDMESVLLRVYDKLTDAAINYLFELAKIQVMKAVIGEGTSAATGGGTGGGLMSFLGLNANGNVFNGMIKPYKNGGIINRPTMFGLAGEAGEEAIMPLARIGGKLGVRAQGGGQPVNFHFHGVVDGDSAIAFFQRNSDQLAAVLGQRSSLGKGSL